MSPYLKKGNKIAIKTALEIFLTLYPFCCYDNRKMKYVFLNIILKILALKKKEN